MAITVIGSGRVGASIALNCAINDLDDILMLDVIQGLPQGEAMDINHQLSEMGIDRLVRGSNNYADIGKSDVIVLVAGLGRKPGMTRMDLLNTNAAIVNDVSKKIASYAKDSTLIVVTNPLDPMTYLALKASGLPKSRVIGMGGLLDLSRFKSFVHSSVGISRDSIQAIVIGEHGENMLPLVRFCTIGGIPLEQFVDSSTQSDIFEKTRSVAAEVISLKGATIHAPGNAVAKMIEAIIKNKNTLIPVSAFLEGEYGVNDICIGVPAVIGRNGIQKIINLPLDPAEQELFLKGVKNVQEAIRSIRPLLA